MVMCKIVCDIIILKIDFDKINDVKYFQADTGFHKFQLQNKSKSSKMFGGFSSGYSFEFQEESYILQQKLNKNPIRLTLSNSEYKLAEGECYWPSYIIKSIDGSPYEAAHSLKCKLSSRTLKLHVIELIIRLKVNPIKSIDIGQRSQISLTNSLHSKKKKPDRKSPNQIFQQLAKSYQDEQKQFLYKKVTDQRFEEMLKSGPPKKRTRLSQNGGKPRTKEYNSQESSNGAFIECSECKHVRQSGGYCSGSAAQETSTTTNQLRQHEEFINLPPKVDRLSNRNFCSKYEYDFMETFADNDKKYNSNWEANILAEQTQRAHLAKLMEDMYQMYASNATQTGKGKNNINAVHRNNEFMKKLQQQQYEEHKRKQKHLQKIYELKKHPLLQSCARQFAQQQQKFRRFS